MMAVETISWLDGVAGLVLVAAIGWRSVRPLQQDGADDAAIRKKLLYMIPVGVLVAALMYVLAGYIGMFVLSVLVAAWPTKLEQTEYEAKKQREGKKKLDGANKQPTSQANLASEIAALKRIGSGSDMRSAEAPVTSKLPDDDKYIWNHPIGSKAYGYIQFRYRNLRGESGVRRVRVQEFTHKGFSGYDIGKRGRRTFNYRGIQRDEVTLLDTGEVLTVDEWVAGLV